MASAASFVSLSKKTTLPIPPTGTPLKLTYIPAKIVVMLDEGNNQADEEAQARLLCAVLESWEMTGPVPILDLPKHPAGSIVAEDQPVPLDVSIVKYLPLPLLQAITDAIAIDARPNAMMPRS